MPRLTEYLSAYGACEEGIDYCSKHKSVENAWNSCDRADWMLWFATHIGVDKEQVLKAKIACLGRVRDIMSKEAPLGKIFADLIDIMTIVYARKSDTPIVESKEYLECSNTVFNIARTWPRHLPFIFPNVIFNGLIVSDDPAASSALAYEVSNLEDKLGGVSLSDSLKHQSEICKGSLSDLVFSKSKELGLIL